ncbi:unnamed protein product [Trichobilharzia szidati]|nr:unnamed protein product [Trichobilharzia szidati]
MEKTKINVNLNHLHSVSRRRLSYTRMVMLLVGIQTFVSIAVTLSVSAIAYSIQNILKCIVIFTIIFTVIADMSALSLLAIPKIRLLLPINIIILSVYTISASIAVGLPFACMNILWALTSWGTTFILFFSTVVGGASIRVDLMNYWRLLLAFLASEFIATLITSLVLTTIGYLKLAIIGGQKTFGQPGLRTIDPDYCLASIILHANLLLLFIVSSVEFYYTLPRDPSKCKIEPTIL